MKWSLELGWNKLPATVRWNSRAFLASVSLTNLKKSCSMRTHYLSGRFCQFRFIRINCFCNLDRRSKITSNLGSDQRHFNFQVGNADFPIGAPTQNYYPHVFSLKNTWTITFQFLPRINKVICMCNAEASTKLNSLPGISGNFFEPEKLKRATRQTWEKYWYVWNEHELITRSLKK